MKITLLHIFGWNKEQELHTRLEHEMQMSLTKTEDRYDTKDFLTEDPDHFVELKCRTDLYGREDFTHWVIPTKKFWDLEPRQKITAFYFWDKDQTLWRLEYEYALFKTFNRGIPSWHTETHFWIPAEYWIYCPTASCPEPPVQAWLGVEENELICSEA